MHQDEIDAPISKKKRMENHTSTLPSETESMEIEDEEGAALLAAAVEEMDSLEDPVSKPSEPSPTSKDKSGNGISKLKAFTFSSKS